MKTIYGHFNLKQRELFLSLHYTKRVNLVQVPLVFTKCCFLTPFSHINYGKFRFIQ